MFGERRLSKQFGYGRNSSDEPILSITEEERAALYRLVETLGPIDSRKLNGTFFTQLEMIGHQIPERIKEGLIHFRRYPNRFGALLLRGLPVDLKLPPTPQDGNPSSEKTSFVSEYLLMISMLFLGEPIGYSEEKRGQLIHDICPVQGQEDRQENSGSRSLFEFHTEDAFHPHRPDHLALFCLRSDHDQQARTDVASIVNAMQMMPSAAITLLRQPLYRLRAPSSFGTLEYATTVPVLTGSLLQPELCMNSHTMEGINSEAQWALDTLIEAFEEVSVGYVLLPGDLIIIDNRLAVHGRSSFSPRYDGEDRWLQRLFTVTDIRRSSFSRAPNQNVCVPLNIEFAMQGSQ
ncbi:TauD/TfdA family dioxygenase [Tumebacillus lipolyticus]|uniref:TauD/TfdA family dioxygenase n=1 Tax=Tumebacillus lipolyticus TaxID=1280370 RepID=A0ABW5A352_9BACL